MHTLPTAMPVMIPATAAGDSVVVFGAAGDTMETVSDPAPAARRLLATSPINDEDVTSDAGTLENSAEMDELRRVKAMVTTRSTVDPASRRHVPLASHEPHLPASSEAVKAIPAATTLLSVESFKMTGEPHAP